MFSTPPRPEHTILGNPTHSVAAVSMSDAFATDGNNKPLTYRAACRGPDSALWHIEESKELLRLIDGTHIMKIDWDMKPVDRKASYYNPQIQCKVKDGITVRRIRGTYGGNISDYSGIRSSYTADLQTVKLHYNAVVSEGAKMLTLDLTDFYLGSVLPRPEYMCLTRDQVPLDIQQRYKHTINWRGNRALVQIDKGIYGLPQAGKLAQDDLIPLLSAGGYHQCKNTPLLFKHESRAISFVLVVDDFPVKYQHHDDALHLMSVIGKKI
jgi:hypothetical protein